MSDTNILGRFTMGQLEAELERRQERNLPESPPGKDWYYAFNEDGNIWIVHKRFWHIYHRMDDRYISDYLPIVPDGFVEYRESLFTFETSPEEAERELQELGYDKLLDYPIGWEALIVQYLSFENKNLYRVNVIADTPELKDLIKSQMRSCKYLFDKKDPEVFNDLNDYKYWMNNFSYKIKINWHGEYSGGCCAYVMSNETFNSLPLYPEGYQQ